MPEYTQKIMVKKRLRIIYAIAAVALASNASAGDKPLKVYILAGQSNMEGKAQVRTIERLKLAGGDAEMYKLMMGENGKVTAPKGVYGVTFVNGDMKKGTARPLEVMNGPLLPGYTQDPDPKQTFGPEYTFGIYMQKQLNEPILIIKTAWGGRDLIQQFRPPSAGDYGKEKDRHGNETGAYYKLIIQDVEMALAKIGDYHPDYDAAKGYEIAGFVWFQGFNDLIGPYPKGDYSEYGRILSCFIRDVRKDLKAPKMPFVIGVMGMGGPIENKSDNQARFREAQATPAALPEYKGNVAAVQTAPFWDMELLQANNKLRSAIENKLKTEDPKITNRKLNDGIKKQWKSMASEILSPEQLKIMEVGVSNEEFHYMGSALIYGKIGKAFADSMYELSSKN